MRSWLLGFYIGASGNAPRPPMAAPWPRSREGGGCAIGSSSRSQLPAWLTEADVDFYTAEFEGKGFRGALNRYRNVDRDWADLQPWGRQPDHRAVAVYRRGRDGPTIWGQRAIGRFPRPCPGFRGSHILPGCGHWVQQERAEEVNDLLVGWLKSL